MYIKLTAVDGVISVSGHTTARLGSARRKLGPWAKWDWDGVTLDAEIDRYGMYPLFWAKLHNGVAIADSVSTLLELGVDRTLNDSAIAAFLRFGFFLGEDTPFHNIRTFPPQGRLSWRLGRGPVIEGRFWPRKIDCSLGHCEVVSGYVDRFRKAILSSLPNEPKKTALPLSGGRDSRHIALELHRTGFQPGLVLTQRHFPSRRDDDQVIASMLCQALEWQIDICPQSDDPVGAEMEKNRLFDCLTDEHAWFLPASKHINRLKPVAVYDGIAGDVLSSSLFIRDKWIDIVRNGNLSTWLEDEVSRGYGPPESTLGALLNKEYRMRWSWDAYFQRAMEELDKHTGDENPIYSFMFWNRTRREIAPFMIRFVPDAEVITPYLDHDVFDFLWNTPMHHLKDHRLHDEAITLAAPEYARIPYAKGGANNEASHTIRLMRGMARRALFWKPGEIIDRRWLRPRLAGALVNRRLASEAHWYAQWAVWLACFEMLQR